ncbi:MAG: AAA family ATPase, partial [Myxococcota bacterium]
MPLPASDAILGGMIFRWDDCELDDEAGELRRGGVRVEVQPKPFELLLLLVRARPRTVASDELMRSLWPGVVVTPASLNRAVTSARRAIGDTGRGERIDSVPRRGYRFAGEVEVLDRWPSADASAERVAPLPVARAAGAAAGAPIGAPVGSAPIAAPFSTPFVGRAEALATLRGARRAAEQGIGAVVLVSGPAGIGKTRLLRAFVSECEQAGVRARIGHCRDREGAPAYWVWQQLLTAIGAERETEQLHALRRQAETLARSDTARGDGPSAGPEQSRFLFFEGVLAVLREWAAEGAGVIVLEDLQWAGSESLALLEHVAFEIESTRLLLVASLREEPAGRRRVAELTRVALRRMEHCHPIELARFTRREIEELARQVLGDRVPPELVEALDARTEGVPLFLRERLRELDGAVRRGELPELVLSRTLAGDSPTLSLVRRAIEGLPESCVAYLEAAAVLGREFPLPYAAEVAGLPLEEAARAFDQAALGGIVEEAGQSASGRFSHALYREALYDGIA